MGKIAIIPSSLQTSNTNAWWNVDKTVLTLLSKQTVNCCSVQTRSIHTKKEKVTLQFVFLFLFISASSVYNFIPKLYCVQQLNYTKYTQPLHLTLKRYKHASKCWCWWNCPYVHDLRQLLAPVSRLYDRDPVRTCLLILISVTKIRFTKLCKFIGGKEVNFTLKNGYRMHSILPST